MRQGYAQPARWWPLFFRFFAGFWGGLGTGASTRRLRFLADTLLSFAAAPVAGRLSAHVPVRLLLGGGLVSWLKRRPKLSPAY